MPTSPSVGYSEFVLAVNPRGSQNLLIDRFYLETDFSKGHLLEILRGRGSPSVSTLVKLAAALGVEIKDFVVFPERGHRHRAIELVERASLDQVRRVLRLLGGEQEDD